MTSSRTVTVSFTTARLTVNKTGTGKGTVTGVASPPGGTNANINRGTTCISNNANNTSVVLTAVPAADSSFLSWSGCTLGHGRHVHRDHDERQRRAHRDRQLQQRDAQGGEERHRQGHRGRH